MAAGLAWQGAGQSALPSAPDSVVVEARVVDRSGRPATDLTATDFDVRVNGVPRTVTAVRYEEAGLPEQPSSVLVAVDRNNLRIETSRGTLDAAARFVEGLAASHAVGVMVLPEEKMRVAIGEPAVESAKVLRRILGAYSPDTALGEDELSARTALHRVIGAMSAVKGRRTVVWLADRMYHGTSTVDTARRAALQSVAFYVMAADAPMSIGENREPEPAASGIYDGLAGLAAASGGALMRRSAGAGPSFERLSRELSGTYVLTFRAEPSDTGRHSLRVDVKRSGLEVRARREFVK